MIAGLIAAPAGGVHGLPAPHVVALLILAAAVAGWVDAVVGGGGLIQLPALLLLLPAALPVQVLATNKVSSICGTGVSAVTYGRRIPPQPRTALPMAALALVGAVGGALIASHVPEGAFKPVVLVALVAVATFTWLRPALGAKAAPRFHGHRHAVVAGLVGLGIGIYDGALGPGTGTFLVFTLVGLLGLDFLRASGTAKIANAMTNLGALIVFVPQGAPLWRLGLLMGAANLAGGYVGARTAMARGVRFVRVAFLVVVGLLLVRVGYDVVTSL